MSLINFESSWKKASERVEINSAREKVLEDAEIRAKKIARRKEKEDSWMLPDLENDLTTNSKKQHKHSKHKKEKKKKHKKDHKSSKHKKHKKSKTSSSSSSTEDEWVEQKPFNKKDKGEISKVQSGPDGPSETNLTRDTWMNIESLVDSSVKNKDVRGNRENIKAEERKTKENLALLEQNKREINSSVVHVEGGKLKENDTAIKESKNTATAQIGDGGASWLRRAFQRAKEQAQREGVSIDEIAEKRWGSLANFEQMLAKAEGRTHVIKDNKANPNSKLNLNSSNHKQVHMRPRSRSRSPIRKYQTPRDNNRDKYYTSNDSNLREKKGGSGSWKNEERVKREKDEAFKESKKKRRRSDSSSSSSSSDSSNKTNISQNEEKDRKIIADQDSLSKCKQNVTENTTNEKAKDSTEEVVVMSDKEMNILGAKLVKAEIMGNSALADKLKAKLDAARKSKESMKIIAKDSDTVVEKEIVLTRTDSRGMTRPVEADVDRDTGSHRKRKKKEKVQTHVKGERQRYFADDDRYDLKQMYEREKMSTSEDQNSMLSRLAGRAVEKTNDDYDFDDMITDRASTKRSEEADAIRERDRAIAENRKLHQKIDECKFCFGTKNMQKHLTIAVGRSCYLCLPHHTPLTEFHCFIAPLSHVSCGIQLDEDVWSEMQEFRKALTSMFEDEDDGNDCIFFESALRLKKHPHMLLECVPIPREIGETAPMYFQKAIQECESEWSHNKKLISLTKERGLRRSIPRGLPYFHVDFGNDDGFAHVIEDEQEFDLNFAQQIIGGMLDIEPRVWRHPKRESFEAQKKRVLAFASIWKKFDFTKKGKSKHYSSSESD